MAGKEGAGEGRKGETEGELVGSSTWELKAKGVELAVDIAYGGRKERLPPGIRPTRGPAQVWSVMGGVKAKCSMDLRTVRAILCPFRRSAEVHQTPANNNASGIKEWRNLIVMEGGDIGGGRPRRHSHRRGGGQGQGRRGRGARILDLRKQDTFDVLCGDTTKAAGGSTGKALPRSNPIPPVLRDAVGRSATTRGRRCRESGGRRGGRRGSGRRRPFDPQHRGRAREPKPQGGHGHHRAIRWG